MLDFWGTPPEQNHIKLDGTKQFLVPYRNPWNQNFGFVVDLNLPTAAMTMAKKAVSKVKIVVHGKMGRYFLGRSTLIHHLASMTNEVEVHTTLHPSQMLGYALPPRVFNHGMLSATDFAALLASAHVVLGM
jgi:hypothetical protein